MKLVKARLKEWKINYNRKQWKGKLTNYEDCLYDIDVSGVQFNGVDGN
jgi:hypothetical protein